MLVCTVGDDGRGVELETVRRRIVDAGLAGEDLAKGLNPSELFEFLFLPGFSTAEKVTEISGRGVGLDVVADVVRSVGGSVRMDSKFGKGSRLELQLPVTLSVIRAAVVQIADELYAFPLARIEGIASTPTSTLEVLEDRLHFTLDGRRVGLVSAHQALGLRERPLPESQVPIVVLSDRGKLLGLWVDCFVGQRDLVVRPLDSRLGKTPNITAAAIMADGRTLLIVDEDDLVHTIETLLREGRLRGARRAVAAPGEKPPKRVLVVDDSITVRQVERRLLENRGYEVDVAVDGVDAWNALAAGDYQLVVSDVDMPRMNGIDLVRRIRQERRFRTLPIVIVSYKDRPEDRRRGLEAGASAYLTKTSFQDDSLARRVAELIGEARE
jgi:two-component system sensor histidine kinase and response regulator WspE